MSTNFKRKSLVIKVALLGLTLVGGVVWFVGSEAQAHAESVAAPAVSRPSLTVRTTALHEG
jgi:hypothetical protein